MEYDRNELHEIFRQITNIVEPNHSYSEEYPIEKGQLETTWNRRDSNTWATCGPRRSGRNGYKAKISFDIGYMNKRNKERILCIINHELTHIEEGLHTPGSGHNPAFWNAVVKHAKMVIDHKGWVEDIIGQEFNTERFIEEVVTEPNNSMTDGRIETPEERQEKMRDQLEGYRR